MKLNQECLWYIKPNKWNIILNKLYNMLSINNDSMLVITMTWDESVSASIYKDIEPKFQIATYIINYFNNLTDKNIKIDIWKEECILRINRIKSNITIIILCKY